VFKRIAETTILDLGVAPNLEPAPVVFARQRSAPREDAATTPVPRVTIVRTAAGEAPDAGVMPDLIGLNAREATRVLARVGMTPRLSGDGIVVQQDPRPGTPMDHGTVCSLALGRPVAVVAGSDQHQ
jgi:beta-lactam-binding protein with PASTA domain